MLKLIIPYNLWGPFKWACALLFYCEWWCKWCWLRTQVETSNGWQYARVEPGSNCFRGGWWVNEVQVLVERPSARNGS